MVSKNTVDDERVTVPVDGLGLRDHDGLDLCANLVDGSTKIANEVYTFEHVSMTERIMLVR